MLIKSLSALSPPLHHPGFLLHHFLFPMTHSELASISMVCPIRCQFYFYIQPTKSLPAFRLILWSWFVDQLCSINSYGKYFLSLFSFNFFLCAYLISFTLLSAIFLKNRCTSIEAPLISVCRWSVQQWFSGSWEWHWICWSCSCACWQLDMYRLQPSQSAKK